MSSTQKVPVSSLKPDPTPAQLRLLFQRHAASLGAQILQNCLNCVHWQKGDANKPQGCTKYRQLPPPDVIVHGCEQHDFDIPF